jgi:hypothetical protein
LKELEASLATAQAEAAKVKPLQAQLEELQVSSAADKQTAIDNLTKELLANHQKDLDSIKSTHESEQRTIRKSHEKAISDLKSTQAEELAALEDLSIHAELRKIKAGFEKEKADAVNTAVLDSTRETRAIAAEEIRSLQSAHTAEKAKLEKEHHVHLEHIKSELSKSQHRAVHDAVEKEKHGHQKEMEAIAKQRDEIQKKASGEMKTLSDAHSSKTTSLQHEIATAKAAEKAAEEKSNRAMELEQQLHVQSKELSEVKAELDTTKHKLADLETKYDQLSLAYFETG